MLEGPEIALALGIFNRANHAAGRVWVVVKTWCRGSWWMVEWVGWVCGDSRAPEVYYGIYMYKYVI